MREFYLGRLDPNETERVELRLLDEPESEHEFAAAENDLIEDYLEGALPEADREAFETNFLVTEERRKKVEFLGLLKQRARAEIAEETVEPGYLERFRSLITPWRVVAALGSLVLVAAIGFALRTIANRSHNAVEAQIIALNKTELSDPAALAGMQTLDLAPGKLRSTETGAELDPALMPEKVVFRLAFPERIPAGQSLTATVSRDELQLFSFPVKAAGDREVRLILPRAALSSGEYRLQIGIGSEKVDYFFSVR